MKTPQPAPASPDNNAPDLIEQLRQATAGKPEPLAAGDGSAGPDNLFNQDKTPPPDLSDFTPEPVIIPEPAPDLPPPPPPPPTMSKKRQAELIISFVDGVQCLALPYAYQKSIFTADEARALAELKRKIGNQGAGFNSVTLEPEETKLYYKYSDFSELVANVPFREEEIKMLRDPLAAVMEKYNYNAGPESLLMAALLAVMAPRVMPLFYKVEKL